EAFEVAEAVKHHLADAAGEAVLAALAVAHRDAVRRGLDRGRVAAQAVDARGQVADVALEHRVPAVRGCYLTEAPLHDRERVLLVAQQRVAAGHRDLDLEGADDVAPV